MLKKNQIEVIDLFRKSPFLECSILQIKKKMMSKSYQRVYDAVKELEKNKILKVKKVGNTKLVSLSLNSLSIPKISFLDEDGPENKKLPNYEKIISLKELSKYLAIITGSYSKKEATKNSDLDLAVIIPDNENPLEIQKLLENLMLLFYPQVHLYVFKNKDFIEMLLSKEENYGKEIFRNHLILKNAYIYYEILKEAIENGFKG